MDRMSAFLNSRAAAVVVAAIGVALFMFGFARAWELDTVERHGQSEIGHVTEVSDRTVTVAYERMGEDFVGVAYPKAPSDFEVGDVVPIKSLQDAWGRAVIDGTESSSAFYLVWLGIGAGLAALGGIWLSRLWRGSANVATLPQIDYVGHRHGGA